LRAMRRIAGVTPKSAKLVYQTRGLKTLSELENAASSGRLSKLRGMGKTLEATILQGIDQDKAHVARMSLAEAEAYIAPLVSRLRATPGVEQLEVAGSFRRRSETLADMDILVPSHSASPLP